jgi:hypothetical protein
MGNEIPNQPPDACQVDEQQAVETSTISPNSGPQLGGKPFQSKQEVTQSSVTGMDSVEESSTYPVSSVMVPSWCFGMFAAKCQTTC